MRILVTNDDGVHSDGLRYLVTGLKDVGHVCVVAPDRDMSGIGAAMTLLAVVRAQKIAPVVEEIETFSVQGTPGDCVVLATESLFSEPFDLVVSGINAGANIGLDVFVSGTIGGALHGYYRKIPSIAISVAYSPNTGVRYEAAARTATAIARALGNNPPPGLQLLNVNLPDVESKDIESVEITRLGPVAYEPNVEREQDGRRTHYWIKHQTPVTDDPPEGTDIWAIRRNRVSITPLYLDFTHEVPSPAIQALTDDVGSALGIG